MRQSKSWAAVLGLSVALAVGIWIGSTGGNRADAQQPGAAAVPIAPVRTWPPAPKDIVNLGLPREQKVTLSLGVDGFLVYQVPADKALVITDVDGPDAESITLLEETGSNSYIKLHIRGFAGHRSFYSSAVGAVFGPGTKVVIRDYTEGTRFTGYLTTP